MNIRRKKKLSRFVRYLVLYMHSYILEGPAQISHRAWITPGNHPSKVNITLIQKCNVQPTYVNTKSFFFKNSFNLNEIYH